ncbi:hypothetical protein LTR17_017213 [Elasticomyces elasticus]|nr:hypothetical protein LTR17_017213 [Elasticomyces elasticus]
MRRLLLSQSQVSVVVSSSVVLFFTFLLFLSGYIIQQRTVTGLQAAIKPRLPKAPQTIQQQDTDDGGPTELRSGSRLFNSKARISYTHLSEHVGQQVNWQRLAHLQLARNHHDVCNAIMVLAELYRLKSPARRVLLFPQEWAVEKEGKGIRGDFSDPFLASSRRLLRMAARRYGVELRPVASIMNGTGDGEDVEGVYSLASAYALTEFDRVLSIETPGLLLDATPLDAVLAFTESAPFAMLQDDTQGDGVHSADLLLLQPSADIHADLLTYLTTSTSEEIQHFNDTFLPTLFNTPPPLLLASSTSSEALIRSVGILHGATKGFNTTAYLSDVSYIRFSDPKLPGPEYDVPWSQKVAARPRNKDADWTWTKLYGQFAQKRMEICGLDLENWRPGYTFRGHVCDELRLGSSSIVNNDERIAKPARLLAESTSRLSVVQSHTGGQISRHSRLAFETTPARHAQTGLDGLQYSYSVHKQVPLMEG